MYLPDIHTSRFFEVPASLVHHGVIRSQLVASVVCMCNEEVRVGSYGAHYKSYNRLSARFELSALDDSYVWLVKGCTVGEINIKGSYPHPQKIDNKKDDFSIVLYPWRCKLYLYVWEQRNWIIQTRHNRKHMSEQVVSYLTSLLVCLVGV